MPPEGLPHQSKPLVAALGPDTDGDVLMLQLTGNPLDVLGDVATFMAFHDSRSCCHRSASRLPRRVARYTDFGRTPNGSASCLPLRPNHSTH